MTVGGRLRERWPLLVALAVSELVVSAVTVSALGVSALLLAGARIRDGVAAVLVLKTSWQVARRAASRASCCASRCTVA